MGRSHHAHARGVAWDRKRGTWKARIHFAGKERFIGRYKTSKDAALAYDQAARYINSLVQLSMAPWPHDISSRAENAHNTTSITTTTTSSSSSSRSSSGGFGLFTIFRSERVRPLNHPHEQHHDPAVAQRLEAMVAEHLQLQGAADGVVAACAAGLTAPTGAHTTTQPAAGRASGVSGESTPSGQLQQCSDSSLLQCELPGEVVDQMEWEGLISYLDQPQYEDMTLPAAAATTTTAVTGEATAVASDTTTAASDADAAAKVGQEEVAVCGLLLPETASVSSFCDMHSPISSIGSITSEHSDWHHPTAGVVGAAGVEAVAAVVAAEALKGSLARGAEVLHSIPASRISSSSCSSASCYRQEGLILVPVAAAAAAATTTAGGAVHAAQRQQAAMTAAGGARDRAKGPGWATGMFGGLQAACDVVSVTVCCLELLGNLRTHLQLQQQEECNGVSGCLMTVAATWLQDTWSARTVTGSSSSASILVGSFTPSALAAAAAGVVMQPGTESLAAAAATGDAGCTALSLLDHLLLLCAGVLTQRNYNAAAEYCFLQVVLARLQHGLHWVLLQLHLGAGGICPSHASAGTAAGGCVVGGDAASAVVPPAAAGVGSEGVAALEGLASAAAAAAGGDECSCVLYTYDAAACAFGTTVAAAGYDGAVGAWRQLLQEWVAVEVLPESSSAVAGVLKGLVELL